MGKLEEYNDITTRLVSETIACTPKEWTHGTLTIDCDGKRIDYKLKNAEQPGTAVISDALRSLCEELYVCMARHGEAWTQATIQFQVENGNAKFTNSFRYADVEPPVPQAMYSVGDVVSAQGLPSQVYGLGGLSADRDVHNQTLQRTGPAKKRSWLQRLFGRGPGR